jgi:hypothetical protein
LVVGAVSDTVPVTEKVCPDGTDGLGATGVWEVVSLSAQPLTSIPQASPTTSAPIRTVVIDMSP